MRDSVQRDRKERQDRKKRLLLCVLNRVGGDRILILAVIHGARLLPPDEEDRA